MSGIYGCWKPFVKMDYYKKDIERLALWNKAYGNEKEEVYIGDGFCLGCSCEKLSEVANRSVPVLKKNDKYAVIDVVLYNREELMENGQFEEVISDEELIFLYVEKYGYDGLKDVNGDFCGAVYDAKDSTLTLFRDHMGVRPLFYYFGENSVAFSTDMRGLISMNSVDSSINEEWLWSSVVGADTMGTEKTEFAHIFCAKPASYITFVLEDRKIQLNKTLYWQLGSKKIRFTSEKAYIQKMRELITDSVKRRLDAVSGLVGAELSGGLDSGVIDILINRLGRECIYFSWSASPEEIPYAEHDERLVIEDICKQENIVCNYAKTFYPLGDTSIIAEKMREIGVEFNAGKSFMEQYILPPYINTLQISEAAQFVCRSGSKVVFTGHGGDEGVSHRCNAYEMFCHGEYIHYCRYMWSTSKGEKWRLYKTMKRIYNNLVKTRKELKKSYVDPFEVKELLKQDFFKKYDMMKRPALSFAYDSIKYIENGGSRNRLDVVALLGAYSGVRYLMPYLDYRVIDFAVSIPRHMYIKHNRRRYIFREAFKDIMPGSLYMLNRKEDSSWKNAVKRERTMEEYIESKRRLVEKLDREYWSEYLDWDVIEQWVEQRTTFAEENKGSGMFLHLSNCIEMQNLIHCSRQVGISETKTI